MTQGRLFPLGRDFPAGESGNSSSSHYSPLHGPRLLRRGRSVQQPVEKRPVAYRKRVRVDARKLFEMLVHKNADMQLAYLRASRVGSNKSSRL